MRNTPPIFRRVNFSPKIKKAPMAVIIYDMLRIGYATESFMIVNIFTQVKVEIAKKDIAP